MAAEPNPLLKLRQECDEILSDGSFNIGLVNPLINLDEPVMEFLSSVYKRQDVDISTGECKNVQNLMRLFSVCMREDFPFENESIKITNATASYSNNIIIMNRLNALCVQKWKGDTGEKKVKDALSRKQFKLYSSIFLASQGDDEKMALMSQKRNGKEDLDNIIGWELYHWANSTEGATIPQEARAFYEAKLAQSGETGDIITNCNLNNKYLLACYMFSKYNAKRLYRQFLYNCITSKNKREQMLTLNDEPLDEFGWCVTADPTKLPGYTLTKGKIMEAVSLALSHRFKEVNRRMPNLHPTGASFPIPSGNSVALSADAVTKVLALCDLQSSNITSAQDTSWASAIMRYCNIAMSQLTPREYSLDMCTTPVADYIVNNRARSDWSFNLDDRTFTRTGNGVANKIDPSIYYGAHKEAQVKFGFNFIGAVNSLRGSLEMDVIDPVIPPSSQKGADNTVKDGPNQDGIPDPPPSEVDDSAQTNMTPPNQPAASFQSPLFQSLNLAPGIPGFAGFGQNRSLNLGNGANQKESFIPGDNLQQNPASYN